MATEKETREVEILLNAQQANASIKDMAAGVALMNNQLAKMSQDDPRRQALQRDFQVLTQRVGAARAEMRTYVQTEEEVREATEKLNKENLQVILNGQKINSSFKDMKASAAQLEKQLEEMNGDDPGRKKMLDDYHALQNRIAGVKNEMKGATEGTSFLKQGFANAFSFFLGGGILDLVQKLFGFFASAREEFQGSAKTSADLEATLHATKNAAGLTADEIKRIGEERAKITLFDDDETNRASAMLLTFKNVKKGVFEEAIPAIQDLATKMAGDGPADMKGASIQLGKALNDPIKGITALTRVGVTFTDQQKEQITQMVKAGNTAGAQKLILAELNSEFGGSAEAARKAAGGMATLSLRWGEMKETVGSFVSGALNAFSSWLGRVLDYAQPLLDMLSELAGEFATYYREVMDVVEGLGIFSEKTDTAKIVVEVLKTALTLLLMPFRMVLEVSRYLVNNFIEWYNASELLRGTLGGLGALITSLFITIKDDALKILGGVADIIVGIFTLDKDKIAAGFRSAWSATKDLALEAGARAGTAFMEGYEAKKNNRIVRSKPSAGSEDAPEAGGGTAAAGEEGPAELSEKEKKKAKADRDRADREHLADLKRTTKEIGGELGFRNTLTAQLDRTAKSDELLRRDEQRQKLFDAADKQAEQLTGQEADYTEQVAAIVAERDLRLRELAARFAEEDEKERQARIEQQIAQAAADAQVLIAEAEVSLANGVLTQQQYEDAIYAVKQAAAQRELDLIKQRSGQESVEWKKLHADKLKTEADHIKKAKGENESLVTFKKKLSDVEKVLNDSNVKFLEDMLGEQTVLYKAFKLARKAEAIANIGIATVEEIQQYWKTAASMGPVAGPIYGVGMSGVAVLRSGLAAAKIAGFEKGGRTGDAGTMASRGTSSMWDVVSMATGLNVGTNGKLRDAQGLEVAGIVHKNEYVIPEWMRADPQVMQVENWLEQRRRGLVVGGPTSEGNQPSAPEMRAEAEQGDRRLVAVLENLDKRLQGVEEWATQLEVFQDVLGLDRELERVKKVKSKSEIRPK